MWAAIVSAAVAASASYELAYRMQAEAPAAVDLAGESDATKNLYDLDRPECADFGRLEPAPALQKNAPPELFTPSLSINLGFGDAQSDLMVSESIMLEPHQRAALIPNEAGESWSHFLGGRFIGSAHPAHKRGSMAIVMQTIEQQSHDHAALRGLLEHALGDSLPVVSEFTGAVNLETREISIRETLPDRHYAGQLSENGRVLALRQPGQAKSCYLVHEATLADLT